MRTEAVDVVSSFIGTDGVEVGRDARDVVPAGAETKKKGSGKSLSERQRLGEGKRGRGAHSSDAAFPPKISMSVLVCSVAL